MQCAEADPDLFFADRPRNGGLGNRNREYLSIWADDAPGVLRGRSPMQCYEEYMVSLRENFSQVRYAAQAALLASFGAACWLESFTSTWAPGQVVVPFVRRIS